jgi:hypothetical protein
MSNDNDTRLQPDDDRPVAGDPLLDDLEQLENEQTASGSASPGRQPESMEEADVANGEESDHATGERQAEQNREDEPPA